MKNKKMDKKIFGMTHKMVERELVRDIMSKIK